ncbi:peptide chain release factor N(5)-glutamine methyltransferase [Mucilaginibacter litoreus]|uniref:Release factor glutamine methyltransferase n=1 Tax=Mucilaginibacter litoreus TaxID=1048221 RepID=A0ABW3AU80_9SPHI
MKTIKDVFLSFKDALNKLYDFHEIEAITLLVLEEITGFSRAKIKAFTNDDLPADASEKLDGILADLKTGKPVQYVLGTAEFYGLSFFVNPATLIPRPETEELVEWILKSAADSREPETGNLNILDIGTGSGCIAIALKKNLPNAAVTAIDISEDALQTAKKNAVINETDIKFNNVDILNKATHNSFPTTHFNIIVSNPPYVTLKDKLQMHINVNNFEPHTALFVPENDPLIFYKAITNFAAEKLIPGGLLFFEINEAFGKETVDLLKDKSFINIELRQDMSGRDRMVKAVKPY